jgi:hypothetical protein
MLKPQRFAIVLTVINLGLLFYLLAQNHSAVAQSAPPVPSVLRGGALEIVDDQGRVRASIKVLEPSSRLARSTVVLRLSDPNGRPGVKIVASDHGAAVSLVGDATRNTLLHRQSPWISLVSLKDQRPRQPLKRTITR